MSLVYESRDEKRKNKREKLKKREKEKERKFLTLPIIKLGT